MRWSRPGLAARLAALSGAATGGHDAPANLSVVVGDNHGPVRAKHALYVQGVYLGSPATDGRLLRTVIRAGAALAGRLAAVAARTLVVVGEKDEADRVRAARAIAQGIPGAEFLEFPDTSRFLHVEESRAMMRRLTDFFLPEPEIEP